MSITAATRLMRQSFGKTFWVFAAVAVLAGMACYRVQGPSGFREAVAYNSEMLLDLMPRMLVAQVVAGMLWVLVPRERLASAFGAAGDRRKLRRGMAIALIVGAITPGGPATAFSLLALATASGADVSVLVTYITSWALLGIQRIVIWDTPFMGVDFSALRFVVCLPLPLLAGWIAGRLPHAAAMTQARSKAGASE